MKGESIMARSAGMARTIMWLLIFLVACVGRDYTWNVAGVSGASYQRWRVGIMGEPWLRVESWGVGTLENVVWGKSQWVFEPHPIYVASLLVIMLCLVHLHLLGKSRQPSSNTGDRQA